VNLEVLEDVVKEALRLHTAAPASLWRVVPEGGRLLDGYFIPENVICPLKLLSWVDYCVDAELYYSSRSRCVLQPGPIRSVEMAAEGQGDPEYERAIYAVFERDTGLYRDKSGEYGAEDCYGGFAQDVSTSAWSGYDI
jgi:hypothetical protein